MIRFNTRNSTYEVDEDNARVRRVSGSRAPIIGPDGEWRYYDHHTELAQNVNVQFVFEDGTWLLTTPIEEIVVTEEAEEG